MYISDGYGRAAASKGVPGFSVKREMRTSHGPAGMSRTMPPTSRDASPTPLASGARAVATHSPATAVASWVVAAVGATVADVAGPRLQANSPVAVAAPAATPTTTVRRDTPRAIPECSSIAGPPSGACRSGCHRQHHVRFGTEARRQRQRSANRRGAGHTVLSLLPARSRLRTTVLLGFRVHNEVAVVGVGHREGLAEGGLTGLANDSSAGGLLAELDSRRAVEVRHDQTVSVKHHAMPHLLTKGRPGSHRTTSAGSTRTAH